MGVIREIKEENEVKTTGETLTVDDLNSDSSETYNIEEISTMIERLIGDENFRAKQINYGLERVKLFSWANTARELINVYHQVFND